MFPMSGKSWWYRMLAVAVVAIAGYCLGAIGSRIIKQKDIRAYLLQRTLITKHVVERMGTVSAGDALLDWTFEDVDRRSQRLSNLIDGTTIVMFVDPDCGSCLKQFENIAKAATRDADFNRVIAISKGNPLHLLDLRTQLGVKCPLLYDQDGAYLANLNVNTFPLNLVVNENMIIEQVLAGGLLDTEIALVFESSQ